MSGIKIRIVNLVFYVINIPNLYHIFYVIIIYNLYQMFYKLYLTYKMQYKAPIQIKYKHIKYDINIHLQITYWDNLNN